MAEERALAQVGQELGELESGELESGESGLAQAHRQIWVGSSCPLVIDRRPF
jgi:hypothetical protein